ncbi:hypothetical protein GOP47_0001847 [Adiantum capillus-veneris]|uniref:Tudor domain-containing protein n=1 Tax=Adiantum capillus-veneris TaxID=13818 RepID=A0A9D4ZNN2_ADICA|nr:hypothetical protein GOP47_0001847 [Adiantum capillus-veneris]
MRWHGCSSRWRAEGDRRKKRDVGGWEWPAHFLLTHVSTPCVKMRKRSDASKTPVTQRSATRNSTAARRGEERSSAVGKEPNKTPPTVTKAAEEKAPEPIRELASPRRSSLKRETSVVVDASQILTAAPLSIDATVSESLQKNAEAVHTSVVAEASMEGTVEQDAHVETPKRESRKAVEVCKEQLEERAPSLGTSMEGTDKHFPISLLGTQIQVFTADIKSEGTGKQVVEMSSTDPVQTEIPSQGTGKEVLEMSSTYPFKADPGTETLPSAPLLGASEAAGQTDVSGAEKPDEQKTGNADDVPETKELDALEARERDMTKAGDEGRSLPDMGTEIPPLDLSQAAREESNQQGIDSKSKIEKGEITAHKQEGASKTLGLVTKDPLPVVGGGGQKVVPPNELRASPSQAQGRADEAKHTQSPAAVYPLQSQSDQHAPQFIESMPQTQIAQEPLASEGTLEPVAAAETAELTESAQGRAATSNMLANFPLGRVGVSSSSSSTVEVDRAMDKASNLIEASCFHIENDFCKNMVSSVEGETVLIVESLGVLPTTKLENTLSGATGGASEGDGQRMEAGMKVNLESMLEAGKDLVGMKVKKKFGNEFFEGKVVEYEPDLNWYKVMYEDGDEEELDLKEVRKLVSEVDDDEQSADKQQHWQASDSTNSLKRNVGKARSRSPAASDGAMEEDGQLQERVRLGSLKRRHVIDTSNDVNADSPDSDDQLSPTSEESSDEEDDDDEDDDETVGGKRRSRKKPKGKSRSGKRRRKTDNKFDEEKVFTARLKHKAKEEKSQETSTEHRIATRRSTGALSTQLTSSDDHSLSSHKKTHTNSHHKPSSEAHTPLGGGAKLVGRKTKKDFGGEFYYGEIIHYDNRVKYYKVRYEDGDEEELEWAELAPTLLPQEKAHILPIVETSQEAASRSSQARTKDHSKRASTVKGKEGAIVPYDGGANNGDLTNSTRKWRKKVRTASVSVMMKGTENWNAASTSAATAPEPPRPLAAVRFASASDADVFEYFGWGEAVNFDRSKCPELRATRLLPTSSPVVHLAASRHHLVALTGAGQVWVWRCKHGNVHTRCNEWEHVAALDNRNVILVDISGPDVDRASAGYQPEQEDQVPDPFYLAAVCSNGEDIILQGSQPHESVHTYNCNGEPQHPGLREAVLQSNPDWLENMGRIVQVSVGMVEAADESPFVGYITDTDCVFIRSATRDFMEEVNLVTGYTGKPLKIQCGRVYHAILLTDDGRAWTWGQGYYPGSNVHSAGFASKWPSPFSVCQPAVGTLVGRKVVDVGCYGEDFIALTNDGDVHQWTHALPNPAAGVYNVPATPVYGQRPSIGSGDKLKHVTIGAGICAGISESGKVHTWRTSLKGGFVGMVGVEREATTPLGREEGTETAILALGTRAATKVMCVAGSLLVVVKRKYRGRRGGKRKSDASGLKGKVPEDEAIGNGDGDGEGED